MVMNQMDIRVPSGRWLGLGEVLEGNLNFICVVYFFIYNEKQSYNNFPLKSFFFMKRKEKEKNWVLTRATRGNRE